MKVSDIILMSRNLDSFSNLLPLFSLTTDAQVKKAQEDGYDAAMTFQQFLKEYDLSEEEGVHLYLSKSFGPMYYWDGGSLIVFPLHVYGGESILPRSYTLKEAIRTGIAGVKAHIEKCEYSFVVTALNDRMRMEYLTMLIDRDIPNPYESFCSIYQTCDYGCSALGHERMRKLLDNKPQAAVEQTKEKVSELSPVVTIFRGVGSKSASLDKTFSWSTKSQYAVFFATRMETENAKVYIAKVKREDIIEYFPDYESECWVFPENVFDVQSIDLYGPEWCKDIITTLSPDYWDALDNADESLLDILSDGIHGMQHAHNVLLFCLILANQYDLPYDDVEILIDAALYHDVGRTNDDVDEAHGAESVKLYKQQVGKNPFVCFLMEYHCKPDSLGYERIEDDPVLSKEKERAKQLYQIFKDADALDRFRLGNYELDITQLRTEEAKKMVLVAFMASRLE